MSSGRSIRRQLILPLLAGFFVVTACISGLSAWLQSSRSLAALQRRQLEVAQVLEEAAFPLSGSVLKQLSGLTGLDIVVWDPASSKIVDQSISKAPLGLPEYLLLQPPADADSTLLSEFRSADDVYQVRTVVSRWAPQYRIVTLTSQRVLDEARWNAAWPPVAIGVAALLAVLPWLVALTGNWTNRLRQIQSRVSGIAQGRLRDEGSGESIPDPGGDELSSLIYDVTKLGEHLAELQSRVLQAEREQWIAQLASGFAHQFRNGIAGISLALQVHQNRCSARSDRSMLIMEKQLKRLETEVRGLLSLGRRAEGIRTSFVISEVVRECLELVSPSMEHHDVCIEQSRLSEGVIVFGIRDGLRAAIVNLLQNAIDAAGHQGKIQVQLTAADSRVLIEVADNGPGPSQEVADRMLESFVTTKPEGVGLGLAIVNAIAQDHGGEVRWRRSDGWTTMELRLPLQRVDVKIA